MEIVQNELVFWYNGRISDEGVSGTWAGKPDKYPATYEEWVAKYWSDFYEETGNPLAQELMQNQIKRVPEGLK